MSDLDLTPGISRPASSMIAQLPLYWQDDYSIIVAEQCEYCIAAVPYSSVMQYTHGTVLFCCTIYPVILWMLNASSLDIILTTKKTKQKQIYILSIKTVLLGTNKRIFEMRPPARDWSWVRRWRWARIDFVFLCDGLWGLVERVDISTIIPLPDQLLTPRLGSR